jgi:hypothetical protein
MNQYLLKDSYKIKEAVGYQNIKGSPYLHKDFTKGDIFTNNGIFSQVDLKFDIYEGTFLMNLEGKNIFLDQQPNIKKVLIAGQQFHLKNIGTVASPKLVFLALLDSGQVALYARKNISLHPEEPPRALETEVRPAQFVKQNDSFYLQMGTGNTVQITHINDFYTLFSAHANALKEIVKKEKLSIKKEADLRQIIRFCNTNQ